MAPTKKLNELELEDVDFEAVKECSDKNYLKRYIKLLEDDGSYFVELLNACKEKLLEVCPKEYYLLYPRVASAAEVDDITKDLLDWQESVQEIDTALIKSRKHRIWDDAPGANISVPIRGQEPMVARPNLHKKEKEREVALQKPKSEHDGYARDKTKMRDYYRAWDQVDVDAMEAEFDAEEQAAAEARRKHFDDLRERQDQAHEFSPIDVNNVPSEVPTAHRKHLADTEKEKGNEAFFSKDFEEAEAYYSRSLHFLADDPSVWANRALVRLKLDKADGALEDCEHALAISPHYMKALHRKGKALYELQRYAEAVQSFQLALMESPGNTQINGDLMVARRKLRSDGPAPPQPQTYAPPARNRRPDDPSTCVIEEVVDDEVVVQKNAGTKPEHGYTRVLIEEDSDSDSNDEQDAPSSKVVGGFHKVEIQEDSDESEAGEPPVGESVHFDDMD